VYAECVDEHLEGNTIRLREQQSAPRLPRLGAGHSRIYHRPSTLLEDHSDAKIASNLEAVRVRHGHQKLPRGQRTNGLTDFGFGRHLIEKVDNGIDSHHLSKAVSTERYWSGAH
jgi:hypothetical protein